MGSSVVYYSYYIRKEIPKEEIEAIDNAIISHNYEEFLKYYRKWQAYFYEHAEIVNDTLLNEKRIICYYPFVDSIYRSNLKDYNGELLPDYQDNEYVGSILHEDDFNRIEKVYYISE